MAHFRQRAWLAWAAVSLLALLCGVLAVLQYRWIGEITEAERSRLREALQNSLFALSRSFNEEISSAANALFPSSGQVDQLGREAAYATKYQLWKDSHEPLFQRIALAIPDSPSPRLLLLDPATGQFSPADWPPDWTSIRDRLTFRFADGPGPRDGRHPTILELPRFPRPPDAPGMREPEWLLLELNLDFMRATFLPQLLNRYLAPGGRLDYDAEIVAAGDPPILIYDSAPARRLLPGGQVDASVPLLEIRSQGMWGRGGLGGRGSRGRGPEAGRGPGPEFGPPPSPGGGPGRWRLLVRHSAGSLELLVAQTRRRNLAVSAGILLLILVTVAVLLRFSRRAHQLAELQMNFVAGVSHELRTPLTVIRTAAFNLKGKLAARPDQVEKYGALIQGESEKLTLLVEQVLRFASAEAGHAIRAREPVAVGKLIEDSLRSGNAALRNPRLQIEQQLDPGLRMIVV
jgi:signal transduction histidine kinase